MQKEKTRRLVLYALFTAFTFLLGLTPIGYIYLPFASITIMHIPMILAGFLFGVKGGLFFGFLFGLTSLISCFIAPDMIAMIVLGTNTGFGVYNIVLVIAVLFLPRILAGFLSAVVYKVASRKRSGNVFAMGGAAIVGALTNTVFLLGALYLFAYNDAAAAFGLSGTFTSLDFIRVLLGIVSINGALEAAAALILATAIGKVLINLVSRKHDT